MYIQIKLELNTDTGKGDMTIDLEQGADPSDIDFEKVAKQVTDMFKRYGPEINAVKVEKVKSFKENIN